MNVKLRTSGLRTHKCFGNEIRKGAQCNNVQQMLKGEVHCTNKKPKQFMFLF